MADVKAPAPKVFYFGYLDSGHHMYEPGDICYLQKLETPWGSYPDSTLCPEKNYQNGLARLEHKDGWTAIGFWDQSGDTRPGSNSMFLVRGTYTFDEMLALAKAQWAGVFARMRFPVVEIQ